MTDAIRVRLSVKVKYGKQEHTITLISKIIMNMKSAEPCIRSRIPSGIVLKETSPMFNPGYVSIIILNFIKLNFDILKVCGVKPKTGGESLGADKKEGTLNTFFFVFPSS